MRSLKDVLPRSLPAEWQMVRHSKTRAVYNQIVFEISKPAHRLKPPAVDKPSCQELGCLPDPGGRMTSRPGLCVAVLAPERMNGREWMHLIVTTAPVSGNSHPSSYPLINDLEEVRRLFLGPERTATLVLKPESQKNQQDQPCQVHLWAECER